MIPQGSPQSPEPTPETPQKQFEATTLLPPDLTSTPTREPLPPGTFPLPFTGPLCFLQPFVDFFWNPRRVWRPVLVCFGIIVLVGVAMGLSVDSKSRNIPFGGAFCDNTGVGLL